MARTSLSNSHLNLNPSRNIAHVQNTVLVDDVLTFGKYNAVFARSFLGVKCYRTVENLCSAITLNPQAFDFKL